MADNFPVPSDAYLAFDGLSIRDKIRERLNQTGIFSDQNFEGSNISALNDVISMTFSLLLYNLNKTSANGMFSETTLYKNINNIVKELNYSPLGCQTASLNYTLSATNLPTGIYTIPRYSFISLGGISYSINDDLTFNKTLNNEVEEILNIDNSKILYQGEFREYPIINFNGSPNEIIFLTVDDNVLIDHFNIFVYVKEPNGAWKKWKNTASLYLQNANDESYEIRFNENKRYEIKFGNNINGKQPSINSQIAIYYLETAGTSGEVGINVLDNKSILLLNTIQLSNILSDLSVSNIMNKESLNSLIFDNSSPSTYFDDAETVDRIKQNAPLAFRSQFNLTTTKSYDTFIRTNFANIIHDVSIMNNEQYLASYTKYFYNLGLTDPHLEYRALYNQIKFADSCNFNNIYCFCIPKTRGNSQSYIFPEQKSIILNTIQEEKVLTSEVIIADPVYLAIDFASSDTTEVSVNDIDNTNIIIYKDANTRKSDAVIKGEVENIIINFFSRINNKIGQTININQLIYDILAIDGVKNISTEVSSTGSIVEGLHMILWNPIYPTYITKFSTNITLENFQFPFLYSSQLSNRLKIV